MAVGLMYGGTWLKGARYGGKAAINTYKFTRSAYTASKTTKNVLEARNIVKLTHEASPLVQKIWKASNKIDVFKPVSKGINPFKGKTFQEVDQIFRNKGFLTKGPDPLRGKGSYFHPITNRKYYLDHAGKTYRNGITELPHVDVHYKTGFNNLDKKRFPLGEKLYE